MARPSAFANSRFMTGCGAVALIGPTHALSATAKRTRFDRILAVNPRPELTSRSDRAAGAEPERRQHRGERSAVALEDEAGANAHDAGPAEACMASVSHFTQTLARKSCPAGVSSVATRSSSGP